MADAASAQVVSRQLDRMATELLHERALREGAIESSRRHLRERLEFAKRLRDMHTRAAAAATDNADVEAELMYTLLAPAPCGNSWDWPLSRFERVARIQRLDTQDHLLSRQEQKAVFQQIAAELSSLTAGANPVEELPATKPRRHSGDADDAAGKQHRLHELERGTWKKIYSGDGAQRTPPVEVPLPNEQAFSPQPGTLTAEQASNRDSGYAFSDATIGAFLGVSSFACDPVSPDSSRTLERRDSTFSAFSGVQDWKPNSKQCHLCGKGFNFVVRPHHCRQCGHCICAKCSPYRVHLDMPVQRPRNQHRRSMSFSNGAEGRFTMHSTMSFASGFPFEGQKPVYRVCSECHGTHSGFGAGR